MQIASDATLKFPRERVFRAYRDEMVELAEHLPNIRRIEVRSREGDPPRTRVVSVWHGGGEIPAAARAFLSESMLSWTDHAEWDESDFSCTWRIETHAFTEAVQCAGRNRFVEVDGATRLEIRGEIAIDASRIRGVPRLLAGRVSSAVTDFLAAKITPNLLAVSDGLKRHLEQRG